MRSIYGKPLAHCIETFRILRPTNPLDAFLCPLFSNFVRRTKRCAVVHDCPAAQALTRKKANAVIACRRESKFGVKALKSFQLRAIKIRIIKVAARLQDDHFFSRCRQNRRSDSSTRA